jgi:hypothetical protein
MTREEALRMRIDPTKTWPAIEALLGHAIDDPAAYYLFETRMAVMWPMDERGLILGEDTYTAGDGFAGIAGRELSPEDLA